MLILFILLLLFFGFILFVIMLSKRPQGWLHPILAFGLFLSQNDNAIDDDRPVEKKRQESEALLRSVHGRLPQIPVENTTIVLKDKEYKVRLYKPATPSAKSVLYFHGGGFVLGNLEAYDNICRWLCYYGNIEVMSFDYPLAPENPFPIPVEAAYQAYNWYFEEKSKTWDKAEIFLCGDSAGGNLSTSVALMACQKGNTPPQALCLLYPALDMTRLDNHAYQSYSKGFLLSKSDILYFRKQYLPHESDWNHPYVSPLNHPIPANMPPCLILTAQFDILSQEGQEFAQKLKAANIPVEYKMYKGVAHGFMTITHLLGTSHRAIRHTAAFINSNHRFKPSLLEKFSNRDRVNKFGLKKQSKQTISNCL
ncbi:MAG: alpha/beta hydrolase [Spirochaetales bacterium]|nr:alpha/beta hydrolase [Spirochaetales bacterium]